MILEHQDRRALKSGINRILDDTRQLAIKKRDIVVYGGGNWSVIKGALSDWESRGLLKVIKPIDEASDEEIVVEMISYIDRNSPWSDWPPHQIKFV